ncbi:precorrin-2 C(20)-methyltransferase [Clostridium sp. D2Q-14]|uniref:precorrin-2 C(20)-methyltransferase n=1 Tax=Anaeromonas gelatinilytica TaxID=2683194 RepID=UPI00193C759C|nr:precorrin-2 C(20)-methyltransferase [Anaeromonas gelatinilytica]
MKGIFYGIGVGPGDSKLLTIKAVETIKSVDVLICPEGKRGKGSVALEIVKEYISDDTEILELTFPMVYQEVEMKKEWEKNIEIIHEKLNNGKNVGFITLGDPMLYSTYMYILPEIKDKGIIVETIPGITSFCASASSSNTPLAMGDETLVIFPLRKNGEKIEKLMNEFDNLVVMKLSAHNEKLAKELEKKGLDKNFVLVSKCGTKEEEIIRDIDSVKSGVPYLSTMIIKGRGLNE